MFVREACFGHQEKIKIWQRPVCNEPLPKVASDGQESLHLQGVGVQTAGGWPARIWHASGKRTQIGRSRWGMSVYAFGPFILDPC